MSTIELINNARRISSAAESILQCAMARANNTLDSRAEIVVCNVALHLAILQEEALWDELRKRGALRELVVSEKKGDADYSVL